MLMIQNHDRALRTWFGKDDIDIGFQIIDDQRWIYHSRIVSHDAILGNDKSHKVKCLA